MDDKNADESGGMKEPSSEDPNSLERFVSFAFVLTILWRRRFSVFLSTLFILLVVYFPSWWYGDIEIRFKGVWDSGPFDLSSLVGYTGGGGGAAPFAPPPLGLVLIVGLWVSVAWNLLLTFHPPRGIVSKAEVNYLEPTVPVESVPRLRAKSRGEVVKSLNLKYSSSASMSFDNSIRRLIRNPKSGEDPKVLGVTSAFPGEGKTIIAFGLTLAAARAGKKVLLVDSDFRRRTLASIDWDKLFSKAKSPADVPSPWRLTQMIAKHHQFSLLELDEHTPLVSQVLWNQLFEALEGLRSQFDIVILDTPPRLVVPDVAYGASSIDNLVYVARWNFAPTSVHSQVFSMLKEDGLGIDLIVMNAVNAMAQRDLMNLGFGMYEGYGYGQTDDYVDY